MKTNPGISTWGRIAWDGAAATPRDVTSHTQWAFFFEIPVTLAAPAIFEIVHYKALAANACAHDPATETPVKDIAICSPIALPAANARITIPAGTVALSVASATTPCEIGPFVALKHISGGAARSG
jgi:hypothetical protein